MKEFFKDFNEHEGFRTFMLTLVGLLWAINFGERCQHTHNITEAFVGATLEMGVIFVGFLGMLTLLEWLENVDNKEKEQ